MAARLTDEFLKWTLDVDGKPAMAALNSMEQSTKKLQNTNRLLSTEMARLEAPGKKNTAEYVALNRQFITNNQTISQSMARMAQLRGEIGLSSLTAQQLRQRMTELRRAMDQSTPNTAAWTQHSRDLAEVTGRYNQVRAGASGTQTVFGQLNNSLTGMSGPIGGAISGIVSMGKAMWALVANPIGATIAAIVGSLTLLYKAFTNTDTGAVAMEGTLKAIGNVMDILIDRAMSYFKMMYSFVTLDFKGMKQNAKDAFGGIGKAVKDAAGAGWEYAKSMDDILDREVAASNRMTKLKVDIEKLTNLSKDQTKTNKERAAAAQSAMDKEIELNGLETGFMAEKNAVETSNLASKIQNNNLTMAQKEAQLKQWLAVDDKELLSMTEKDAAFADFVDKNEGEFQKLQKAKSDELNKEAELAQGTRRLQSQLSGFKKELLGEGAKAAEDAAKKEADAEKMKLNVIIASNESKIAEINKNHLEGKTSEDQFNADLLNQEFNFLQAKMGLFKVGSKEYEEAGAIFLEKQVKAQEQVKTLLLQAEKELSNAKIANLKDGIDKEKIIEDQRWKEELAQLKEKLIVKEALSKEEISINDAINNTIQLKTAVHLKTINDLTIAGEQQKAMDKALIDEAKAQSDNERWTAQAEIAQANYEAELVAADGNAVKIAQAERKLSDTTIQIKTDELNKREEIGNAVFNAANSAFGALAEIAGKETALGKALFLMQQAAAIGQIIFSTAIANAKAVAASPLTLGQPWVTINTVSAGVSIASVIAQAITGSKKGKQSGGYADSAASDSTPVGIYHANEFIATGQAVRNPTVKPILDIIDIAQRTGTIKNLNLAAIVSGGKQTGGYASPATSSLSVIESEIASTLKRLNEHFDRGIKATATVNKYGYGGIDESVKEIAKFKSKVS